MCIIYVLKYKMGLTDKLFMEIEGSGEVLELVASEMSDIYISDGPKADWLFIRGTEDLVVGAELAAPESRYKDNPVLPYQWPHVVVYAKQGSIEGVKAEGKGIGGGSAIIDADNSRSLVKIQSFQSESVNSNKVGGPKFYEAILEVKYNPK